MSAVKFLQSCVAVELHNKECRLMVARSYANMGQFYSAIKELTKVTKLKLVNVFV